MAQANAQEYSAMKHPYWTEVLSIPASPVNGLHINRFVQNAGKSGMNYQEKFLSLVAEGFFPISCSSPVAFGRVAVLSHDEEARNTARFIYEVEIGKHPLVKESPRKGIVHSEQFRRTIESLTDGICIDPSYSARDEFLDKLKLSQAGLTQALATCDVIEHIAPEAIYNFQDFISQWQAYIGRRSSDIDRVFIDEHSLTEGSESPEQHIGMVDKMVSPHKDIENEEYQREKERYNEAMLWHLEKTYRKLEDLTE